MIDLKMNSLQIALFEKTKEMPSYYLQELLDYADFLKEKSKKESETDYLLKYSQITNEIIEASKQDISTCKKELEW